MAQLLVDDEPRNLDEDCEHHDRRSSENWYVSRTTEPAWRTHSVVKVKRTRQMYGGYLQITYLDEKESRRSQAAAEIERLFNGLADQWVAETAYLSSVAKIVLHPAYQQIIGMGERVLPLILRRLRDHHELWFSALSAIARQDPVSEDAHGDIRAMTRAWVHWGNERGYL